MAALGFGIAALPFVDITPKKKNPWVPRVEQHMFYFEMVYEN